LKERKEKRERERERENRSTRDWQPEKGRNRRRVTTAESLKRREKEEKNGTHPSDFHPSHSTM